MGIPHSRKFRWLIRCAVVLLITASASSCTKNSKFERLEFNEERPLTEVVDLEVRNIPGNTTVRGWDKKELQVFGMIRAFSDERAAEVKISHVIKDGILRVDVTWPEGGPQDGETCNVKVNLPVGGDAKVEGQGGFIRVVRMEGSLEVNGKRSAVEVLNHEGDVVIENQGNHISCSEIQGRLKVRNQDGYIKVIGVQNDVDLETTNHKIELVCFPTFQGTVRCVTKNQGIQVTIGRSQEGEFALKADGGKCLWDLGARGKVLESINQGRATITVGSRQSKSLIETSGGSVKLIIP